MNAWYGLKGSLLCLNVKTRHLAEVLRTHKHTYSFPTTLYGLILVWEWTVDHEGIQMNSVSEINIYLTANVKSCFPHFLSSFKKKQ